MNLRGTAWSALLVFCGTLILYFGFLRVTDEDRKQRRIEAANDPSVDLQVAVVWPRFRYQPNSFIQGALLAAKHINAQRADGSSGVLLTREDGTRYSKPLHLRFYDEMAKESPVTIARQIAAEPEILAVVGHDTEKIAQSTIVYNQTGVLCVIPTSTDRSITQHNFPFVFRTAPGDQQIAQAMVDSAGQLFETKHVRVALFYPEEAPASDAPPAAHPTPGPLRDKTAPRGHVWFRTVGPPNPPSLARSVDRLAPCETQTESYVE